MKKEKQVLELFFNEPSKHWHFEQIIKAAQISRPQASLWLKKFLNEKIIKRVKPREKMPYYIGNHESSNYQNSKKLFALEKFHGSGLLNHLTSLKGIKTAIIFGSFSRWDWYTESDIDLFIYGDPGGLELGKYQFKLHREFQLFMVENEKDLKKYGSGLLRNIIKGINIKGNIPMEVIKHAAVQG